VHWSADEPKGATLDYYLIFAGMAALGLFAFARPRWRQIGPSLLDSFVIGLSLFAVGSILVWVEGLADSETVMRIGVSTALSGILGASLWGFVFAPRIAGLNFFADAKRLVADPTEHFMITTGFVVSSLVSVILMIAVFSHDHVRSLLLGALFANSGTLNEARIIVSSGAEGYFAPGYVKQFRDVIVPILCVAAILCDGTYRRRGLLFAALVIALATTLISGQRLVILQYMLCLGTAFLIDRYSPRPHFTSLVAGLVLLLVLFGTVGVMTKLLGRLDAPLSPLSEQQRQKMRQDFLAAQTAKLEAASQRVSVAQEKVKSAEASGSEARLASARKELADAEAEVAAINRAILRIGQGGQPPAGAMGFLESPNIPSVILMPLALAHRAVIAVPRENTLSYPFWTAQEHAPGSGWLTDLGGIRPGTQSQLSNELSDVNKGGSLGNSPLGLATDVFYNWGWLGVMIVPALYALGLLWLDIALTASRSPLTSAAKIFMFFSIPLMYSPFMFVLYGGFVAVGILCYAWLRKKGALSFLEMRPQTRQSPR
jgi:hypothetical protein